MTSRRALWAGLLILPVIAIGLLVWSRHERAADPNWPQAARSIVDPESGNGYRLEQVFVPAGRDSGGIVGVNFAVTFLREDGMNDLEGTGLDEIVRHVDYLANRMGIDHVAFGSDFEGATVPDELAGVDRLPGLVEELRRRGYDESSLAKLTHENWLRVFRAAIA